MHTLMLLVMLAAPFVVVGGAITVLVLFIGRGTKG